ncbi:MAG: hypothetical protein HS110_04570 [Zoogloeaceae bacterium]|nr:hypothetical protein [Zoogloeaceae bacterium]
MSCRPEDDSGLVPDGVGRLALVLHRQRGEDLVVEDASVAQLHSDMQEPPLWLVQGNRLLFSSLAARNQCTALHFYRENIDPSTSVTEARVFDLAHELWHHEIGHADSAAGRFVALLDRKIKALEAAANLISSGEREVFGVLHIVEATLGYLPDITVDELCTLVTVQHPRTEGDLARGMLFNAIENVLVDRPKFAWQLYRHLTSTITKSTLHLATSALLALARGGDLGNVLERVLADAESESAMLAQAALWTIGCLLNAHDLPVDSKVKCIGALRKGLQHETVDVKWVAMHSIELGARRLPELRDDLLDLGRTLDREALAIVVQHLFMNNDAIRQDDRLPDFLEVTTHVPPSLGRCVDDIDWVVSRLWKDSDKTVLLLGFLRTWILRHGGQNIREDETIERFDQTITAICERPQALQRLVTEWLIADEPQLTSACCGLISFLWVRGVRDLSFSRDILDEMDHQAIVHLARRMLGFVYSEEPLLSLTFSLLESRDAPKRTYPIVLTLLTKDVGRNYVEGTLKAITHRMDGAPDPLRSLLESARKELMAYQKALDDLPMLQELRGPIQLRRAIALRKAADMRKTMDAANEKSVFLKLVKQVPIKAGIGCFSVRDGKVGETSHFGSVSHSVTLPRRAIGDPVGYAIEGLLYRLSKRGDE